jgi:dipeptidyl aminopeptidase B
VPTPEGYNHIALFSPVDSSTPMFLTTGEWEVADGILGVDPLRGLMYNTFTLRCVVSKTDCLLEICDSYFRAASPTSIERNIYSVHVPTDARSTAVERPDAITDASVPSYYSASFSPNAAFYLLSYEGPNVPYQKLIEVGDESGWNLV